MMPEHPAVQWHHQYPLQPANHWPQPIGSRFVIPSHWVMSGVSGALVRWYLSEGVHLVELNALLFEPDC
jgi:hypothetical protein